MNDQEPQCPHYPRCVHCNPEPKPPVTIRYTPTSSLLVDQVLAEINKVIRRCGVSGSAFGKMR